MVLVQLLFAYVSQSQSQSLSLSRSRDRAHCCLVYSFAHWSMQTFFMNGIPTGLPQEEEAMLALALWITMQFVGHELLASIVQQAVTLVRCRRCSRSRASSLTVVLYAGQ